MRLSECIQRINGKYLFDYKKYCSEMKDIVISKEIDTFYRNDVERFLNNRKNLMCCDACGSIDSEKNIVHNRYVHDDTICFKHRVINNIWSNLKFYERYFLYLITQKRLIKLYKDAVDWASRRQIKNYSVLIRSNNDTLAKDWQLKQYDPDDICPQDKYIEIEYMIKNVR